MVTNRTPAEAKAEVYRRASELQRSALLMVHTNRTLDRARKALENPWKWAGRYDALEVLVEAAARYERLGGDLDPWKLGRPIDWLDLANRGAVDVRCTGNDDCRVCKMAQDRP